MTAGPLDGVRVLELGSLIAGPFCGRILADFGAEVLKIEPPGTGDPLRTWSLVTEHGSLWALTQSRNKQSMTVDLRSAEGREIVRRLALESQVVIENFRPGRMEEWGLGFEELAKENPALVMVRISGFGQTGPYSHRPGFGNVAESMGGIRYITGWPDRPPLRVGLSIGDSIAALYAVIGTMMALRQAERTGQRPGGRRGALGVGLLDAGGDRAGVRVRRPGSRADREPAGRRRADEHVPDRRRALAGDRRERRRHLQAVHGGDRPAGAGGRPALLDQPGAAGERRGAGRADRGVDAGAGRWTRRWWCWTAPTCRPGRSTRSRTSRRTRSTRRERCWWTCRTTRLGHLLMPGIVPKLSETPGAVRTAGPDLGEHTLEVLGQLLGLDADALESLRSRKVI